MRGDLSKRKVNKAGDLMREYMQGGAVPLGDEFERAADLVSAYRTLHAHPLQVTAAGLRYYVEKNSKARPITVGQRLKRFPTIIDKLIREPEMKLARMHDIAGCRAVVSSEEEVRALATHLKRRWRWVREYDYIREPKPVSGYRALHLVVEKEECLVEIQLRTNAQHAWAELIEATDRLLPEIELKSGYAPADVIEYYRLGAELLAAVSAGEPASTDTLERFRGLHTKVSPYLMPKKP